MHFFEWNQLEFYHYLIMGGATVALLAIVLYWSPAARIRLPAIVVSTLGSLALGLGIGITAMAGFGYRLTAEVPRQENSASNTGGGGMAAMFGGRGPSQKTQLVAFVTKLDQLVGKPLKIDLTDAQKAKVSEQLQGLGKQEKLSEEDAQKRLKTLLDVLKNHRETLEAAGFRWPGGSSGGFRPPTDVPNPFKDENNKVHLEVLLQKCLSSG